MHAWMQARDLACLQSGGQDRQQASRQ